jgi:prepilin-type N-terminal cleavage/methylation domain-containing protein
MNKRSSHIPHRKDQGGFTLIEIIVALMIFSIVAVVSLAALLKIIDANNKSQTIQDAVINMSFSLEAMSREMRSGSMYYCVSLPSGSDVSVTSLPSQSISAACTSGQGSSSGNGIGFAFLSTRTAATCRLINSYEIVPDTGVTWTIKKAEQTACGGSLAFDPIIATSSVTISGYYLQMTNSQYPRALIQMSGYSGVRETAKTYFTVQTVSSPRFP